MKLRQNLTQEENTKEGEYYRSSEYQRQQEKVAKEFWEEVIAQKNAQFQEYIRWDNFEENMVIFLLEKVNVSNEVINKINWKTFLKLMMD